MSDERINSSLRRLIDAAISGSLSSEEFERLDETLRTDDVALAVYLNYCQLEADLFFHGRATLAGQMVLSEIELDGDHKSTLAAASLLGRAQAKVETLRQQLRRVAAAVRFAWGSILRRPAVVFALGVIAAVLGYELSRRPWLNALPNPQRIATEGMPLDVDANSTVAPVARLTYTNGCAWGGDSPHFSTLDSQVRLGEEITLYEGIAEFRLISGVSLSIEGPASLVMTSPTSLILQHGRMTVYVPPSVDDFRLVAASCRITARAAEFGVQVAGGDVDIHSFSGQILAAPALLDEREAELEIPRVIEREEDLAAGVDFSTTTIGAGRGLALVSRGDATLVSRWHPADETQFAPKLPMAGSLPITRAYVKAVLKSKPMGYWRFEESKDGMIANEIGNLGGLVMADDLRLVGDSENRAVDLGRPGSRGALYCKNEINLPPGSDYSVEFWIKPSHVHDGAILEMITEKPDEGKEAAALYLQISNMSSRLANTRQRVRFLHRDPPNSDSKTGTNCYSNIPYRLRRWQHVAAVKQGAEMRLYLDGVLVDTQHDESSLTSHLRLIVGQLGASRRSSPFIGQLDEMAIYGRALSPKEIAKRYELINSQQQPAAKLGVGGI